MTEEANDATHLNVIVTVHNSKSLCPFTTCQHNPNTGQNNMWPCSNIREQY
jgi:hypothetical protein